ncbi:hypothetical protein niasHT_016327 [Heterodera trifolii]|uniref:polynucleotide adenylyltransferase n=1 Tax=Heterodera trifolii TaxID=157864 RepID=A0ABD2KYZ1_9BILA
MDDYYLRILFDETLPVSAISVLCIQLGAVQIHLEIEKRLKIIQKIDKKSNLSREIGKKFGEISAEIQGRRELMASDLCYLFEYLEHIKSLLTSNEKNWAKNAEKRATERGKIGWAKSHECEMFDEIVEKPKTESELRKNLNVKQMFGAEMSAHENAVSHHFKMISIKKEFDKLKRAKMSLQKYLLDQQRMDKLELKHPILLAMGIRADDSVKKLLNAIFAKDALDNELYLEMSICCMNAVAYFSEFNEKINKKIYKKLWKMFDELLEELAEWIKAENRRCLIELYGEDEKFRQRFLEKDKTRERLKEYFVSAEIGEKNETLWHKFIALFKENVKGISNAKIELNGIRNGEIFYEEIQTPTKEVNKMNKSVDSLNVDMVIVMALYTKLLTEMENANEIERNGKHFELLRKLEMNATLWYYKNAIETLFEFFENEIGTDSTIDKWNPKWEKENGNKMKGNEGKREEEKQQTKNLILLLENGTTDWAKMDCENGQSVEEFMNEMRKSLSRMDNIHFFAITNLIVKSERFGNLISKGSETKGFYLIKSNLKTIVKSMKLLGIFETHFPTIFHYELLLDSVYALLLMSQLNFKSDSFDAQIYEGRIMGPFIIKEFQNYIKMLNEAPLLDISTNRMKDKKLAINLKMRTIDEWWPNECETENEIQKAFAQQKVRMRPVHFDYLKRILAEEMYVSSINELKGAKARIRKLLSDESAKGTTAEERAKADQIMARFRTQRYFDRAFFCAPVVEFYEVALFDENAKKRSAEWLKENEAKEEQWVEEEKGKATKKKNRKKKIKHKKENEAGKEDKNDGNNEEEQTKTDEALKLNEEEKPIGNIVKKCQNLLTTQKNETRMEVDEGKLSEIGTKNAKDSGQKSLSEAIGRYSKINDKVKSKEISDDQNLEDIQSVRGGKMMEQIHAADQNESRTNDQTLGSDKGTTNVDKIIGNEGEKTEEKRTTKEELSSKGKMKTNLNELKSEGKAKYESEEEKEKEKEGEENCNGKMPKFDGKVPSRNEHEMANWEPKSEENSEEEDNLDQNELLHLKIGHFSDDNLLSLKYGELFWVLSKESWENDEENDALTVKTLSWTLHFGVYANEISHRIELFGTLEKLKIIGKNEKLEIEKQWEKLKMVELSKIISRSDRSKLMAKLHLLLKKIVASMDGFCAENGTNLWAEIGETKSQLHSRKLAKAMAKSETERQLTRKMDKVILALIQTENNGREDEMPKHRAEFEEQLKAVKHFDGQRKLDQTLFNELTKEANLIELVEEKEREKFRLTKLAQFPERWQEIKYKENSKINEEKTKQILKETQKINHSKETLKNLTDKLEKIIQNWSAEVRIQFSSLMHLQMQLDQIDAIGILPHGFDQRNVLGKFQCDQSDAKRGDQCADESLHCTLCRGKYLNGNWTDEKEKESPKKVDKFRQILAYLELWAKNNQILDDLMGYLNMKMLLTMLTKIFLLYPNGSMPFLVEKFFLTYSTWNWPLPVQLAEINYERDGGFLSWSPFREWFIKRQTTHAHLRTTIGQQLTMPIITPTFPEQNVGANLNGATAKVILNELRIAFDQIKTVNKNRTEIILPLKGKQFIEKFSHFLLVVCSAPQININRFTMFVMQRIGVELAHFVLSSPALAKRVHLLHVNPTECKTEQSLDKFGKPRIPTFGDSKLGDKLIMEI